MKFRTEVEVPGSGFKIGHRSPVMMMGSCFTENVGQNLRKYLFDTCINPLGVIYNPMSVNKAILSLIDKNGYTKQDLRFHDGLYFSFDHYTKFSDPSASHALQKINRTFLEAKAFINKTEYLIITFGTAYVYRFNETGEVVCNCHKIPAAAFARELLDPGVIVEEYTALINKLKRINSHIRIILTVSPVRHLKDGAHGNQVSKSTLLLAVSKLCRKEHEHFSYFPAYEIIMDDLRDYRFYGDDLVHPNDMAIQYIWEKFSSALITKESLEIIRKVDPILKAFQHKPLHPGTGAYEQFLQQRENAVKKLMQEYPFLKWKEING